MATKKEETKVEETPKVETPVEETSSTEANDLLAELENAGITTNEELRNKLTASREVGQMANILGEVKAENRELREALKGFNIKPTVQTQEVSGYEEPVDLKAVMKAVIQEDRQEQNKITAEYQKANLKMWQKINNDPDYESVKPVWEAKMKDPNWVYNVNQGLINPLDEYNTTVRDFFKGYLNRAAETIKTLQTGGKITAPHVETEGKTGSPPEKEISEAREFLDETKEAAKTRQLTEREEMAAINAILRGV